MIAARRISAFACGLTFAIGLGISGMAQPDKVLGFLDVTGAWDPSLLCVMGAALAVCALAFPRILRMRRPIFDAEFHVPETRPIDRRLLLGAAIFGVGWGLGGFCPGPAIVSVVGGAKPVLVFVASMVGGMMLFAWMGGHRSASKR